MWLTLFLVLAALTGFILSVFSPKETEDRSKNTKEAGRKTGKQSKKFRQ
jgi:hypothetical protein